MNEPLTRRLAGHPKDLLPDYVLGFLTPEEIVEVEAHLAGCAECQEEAWDLAEPLVMMSEAGLDTPDEAAREIMGESSSERVLQAIKAELASADTSIDIIEDIPTDTPTSTPLLPEIAAPTEPDETQEEVATPLPGQTSEQTKNQYRHYAWPLTATFALTLALGSLFWSVDTYQTLQQVRADERLFSTYLARPQVQKVVLENVLESNRTEPIGSVLFASRPQDAQQRDVLFVLNDVPQGRAYQAWGHTSSDWDPARGETLESLEVSQDGVFEVDGSGFASLYLSLEPPGGSPQPTNPLSKVSLLNPVADAPITINTPEDGASVSAPSLIVSGVAEPTIKNLSYTLNGGEPTQSAVANNRFSFTVSGLREGRNTIEVRATGAEGEAVTASVDVTYTP